MIAVMLFAIALINGVTCESSMSKKEERKTSPIFSSYRCTGQFSNAARAIGDRSFHRHCVFHNICHDANGDDRLLYFEDSSVMLTPKDAADNKFEYGFYDQDWVQLGAFEKYSPKWAPTIVRNKNGIPFTKFNYSQTAKTYVFHKPWLDSNPGHLFETFLAVYALPQIVGFNYTSNIQMIEAEYSHLMKKPENLKVAKAHREALLPSLSDHKVVQMNKLGNVCFETIFIGTGSLTPQSSEWFAPMFAKSMIATMLENLSRYWYPSPQVDLIDATESKGFRKGVE